MDWIYRVATNPEFPDPIEEVEALAAIDQAGDAAFLLLQNRQFPPMSTATPGQEIGLCTLGDDAPNGRVLILNGTAEVMAVPAVQAETPVSVVHLYGLHYNRMFCQLHHINFFPQANALNPNILPLAEQENFLNFRATVKRIQQL
jgi:hypothetical protein